jgi:crossover junction endodeoxyribonuclease RuvC
MLILGVDPGVTGAYAVVGEDGTVIADDLPVHQAQHGPNAKQRAELDLHTLRLSLIQLNIYHAFIERVAARPGQGTVSTFRFGHAAGALYGLIIGLELPVTLVLPQAWQRFHSIGPSPDAARQRAVELYPALAPRLALKRDSHRADALLIADYGLHQRGGLFRAA